MLYMGSKRAIAKHIIPVMGLESRTTMYVEPFMGGANMLSAVPGDNKWGNEINPFVVATLEAVRDGWIPPTEISEEQWRTAKADNTAFSPKMIGFILGPCSFGGRWGEGYGRSNGKGKPNHRARQASNNLVKQYTGLQGTRMTSMDYTQMDIAPGSIVYCDPPYAGTKEYFVKFDSDYFWGWAEALTEQCAVYVSEYTAPPGWVGVWKKPVKTTFSTSKNKASVERLFTFGDM